MPLRVSLPRWQGDLTVVRERMESNRERPTHMASNFQVNTPAFRRVVGEEVRVEHLATGFGFTEGPLWRGDHLLFSDIPKNRIIKYQGTEAGPVLTTFRYPAGNPNGIQSQDDRTVDAGV